MPMKMLFYWISTIIVFMFFGGMISIDNYKIIDYFCKDSGVSKGSPQYLPPAIPETLEQESLSIKTRIEEICEALNNKDAERASKFCVQPEIYKKTFETNVDKMPLLGEVLKNAKLTSVGAGYTYFGGRSGGLTVQVGSETYTIGMAKLDGIWYFQDL